MNRSLYRRTPTWARTQTLTQKLAQPLARARRPRIGTRIRSILFALLASMLFATLTSGCSHIKELKPWVKPYQRQHLADPIMRIDQHPLDAGYMHHVFQAREAARGAEGGAGGGCGCN